MGNGVRGIRAGQLKRDVVLHPCRAKATERVGAHLRVIDDDGITDTAAIERHRLLHRIGDGRRLERRERAGDELRVLTDSFSGHVPHVPKLPEQLHGLPDGETDLGAACDWLVTLPKVAWAMPST